MKFFNWMHRKLLNPSVVYSRVPHKQQPDVFSDHVKENEADEALLLNNVLDRILTIGTLGIDNNSNSLIIDDQHQEYYEDDEKDHDQQYKKQEQEEQEVKVSVLPLVVTKQSTRLKENEEKKSNVEVLMTLEVKNDQHSHKEHMTEPLLKEDKEKKESKRTTLAELFAAADLPLEKASVPWKEKTAKTNYIASKWKLNKKIVDEKSPRKKN
ncbi:hypothetical protein J5N97_025347 [Dioscorea zingiberensis]|uniref:Protein TILLER ANGLE CONTROL 1 n=1 Tax=Dioscorea zingiberensis TaxID=325984 RepID=A0A9D5H9T4_9LILI|nr:hypothetical protein J5N97_025347 [Dioscorea zingiberensis]